LSIPIVSTTPVDRQNLLFIPNTTTLLTNMDSMTSKLDQVIEGEQQRHFET